MTAKTMPLFRFPIMHTLAQLPPWTMEQRLHHIEVLGERISGYIAFMAQVGQLQGTSAEAKERAVVAFYEQLVILERQLGRVHDAFQ